PSGAPSAKVRGGRRRRGAACASAPSSPIGGRPTARGRGRHGHHAHPARSSRSRGAPPRRGAPGDARALLGGMPGATLARPDGPAADGAVPSARAPLARPDEPRAGPRAPAVAGLSPGATALTSSFPPDPGHSARRVRYASRKHARRGGLGGGPIRPGRKARIPDDRHAVHVPARNRERAITGAPADGTGYRVTGISPFAPFPRPWADQTAIERPFPGKEPSRKPWETR